MSCSLNIRLMSCILSRTALTCALQQRPTLLTHARLKYNIHRIRLQTLTSSPPQPNGGITEKKSLFQRFKAMYKDYWYVLVPVHVVTSLGWIGGFYYIVSSGFDLGYYMKRVGFSESVVEKITKSGAGSLAVAYALYKIATPARYAVTLGGTTLAINNLRNLGYIRPAKELYSTNKEKFQKFQKTLENKKANKSSSSPNGKRSNKDSDT